MLLIVGCWTDLLRLCVSRNSRGLSCSAVTLRPAQECTARGSLGQRTIQRRQVRPETLIRLWRDLSVELLALNDEDLTWLA